MIKIKKTLISTTTTPKLISEISANHGGKLDLAIKLVRQAAKNGSDFVKLQTYSADGMTLNSNNKMFFIKNKKVLEKRNLYYDEGSTPRNGIINF